jgi:hypothetical protein
MRFLGKLSLVLSCTPAAWPQAVTWSEHIGPLIYKNCTPCHRPGQVAPLPMTSYEEVRRRGGTIAQTVHARYMPP